MAYKAKASEAKKKSVKEFTKLIEEYPIIAAVNMENLPTKQLQNMRATLRDTVTMKMAKRRVMKIAIEKTKEKKQGIEKIEEHLIGMPALLFTKENPFKLVKQLQKNKSAAPAKAGQIAPKDILVQAGATPFAPGPIIGELGKFGIKAGIEDGKVAIKEDKVVVKRGEEIGAEMAGILLRLGIEPMEIGLDLVAAYEDGTIFTKEVLEVDEQEFLDKIARAHSDALALANEVTYLTEDNTELILSRAFNEAKALASSQSILTSETVKDELAKANLHMESLKSKLNLE